MHQYHVLYMLRVEGPQLAELEKDLDDNGYTWALTKHFILVTDQDERDVDVLDRIVGKERGRNEDLFPSALDPTFVIERAQQEFDAK